MFSRSWSGFEGPLHVLQELQKHSTRGEHSSCCPPHMSMHELVATKHIHWAHAATDSSKLRSVLLHPAHYKGLTLYEQRSRGSYALTHEELQDGAVRQVATFSLSKEVVFGCRLCTRPRMQPCLLIVAHAAVGLHQVAHFCCSTCDAFYRHWLLLGTCAT